MARGKSCAVKTISFRTKRGKRVTFRGRKGGQSKHGGNCANKADTAGEKRAQSVFRSAARHCHQSSRRARNACVRTNMGKGRGQRF